MWVYLARHGETSWNLEGRWQGQTDVALNATGQAQARELARRLSDQGLTWVASSDLRRARETAAIVADALGLVLGPTDARLRERRFGLFEGLTRQECEARHPEAWARYRSDSRILPAGAEPQDEVVARMRAGVLAMARERRGSVGGHGLIVAHGSCLRVLLATRLGRMPGPLPNGFWCRVAITGALGEEDLGDVEGCDL
jgi:probable phosphoglycerate mutase